MTLPPDDDPILATNSWRRVEPCNLGGITYKPSAVGRHVAKNNSDGGNWTGDIFLNKN